MVRLGTFRFRHAGGWSGQLDRTRLVVVIGRRTPHLAGPNARDANRSLNDGDNDRAHAAPRDIVGI
ncbi:MAG TPA: hypothetical protein VMB73_09205, partial [Acetobacteraceae bacterium]|nr:hypothetical protein [Acetobacteraceae bacterium]